MAYAMYCADCNTTEYAPKVVNNINQFIRRNKREREGVLVGFMDPAVFHNKTITKTDVLK